MSADSAAAGAAATAAATADLPVVPSRTTIPELARKLRDERLSAVVVSDTEGRNVRGIVTERDICKYVISVREFDIASLSRVGSSNTGEASGGGGGGGGSGPDGIDHPMDAVTVDRIMTRDPICAKQSCPPEKIISIMLTRSFRHLPVVDSNMSLVRVLDILTIARIITAEISRQRAAEEKKQNNTGWFSKAIGMINSFMKSTFFSRRSILSMLDQVRACVRAYGCAYGWAI